ncbi:polyhydroxyalkanoic acid system family protein [Parasphingorhabdus sp. JC815]|uniref:polyhydroxyalkanoic acid system family protein n=1 Tax=Parasphingorhabdus sp. JC815 TaxID=3232140 RepID=UPI003459C965
MSEPVTITISHKLGRAEARSRIAGGIHKLSETIPGATLSDHRWEGDTLHCTLEAIGQRIGGEMQVRDEEVYAIFDLPPMLAMFANKIKAKLQEKAPKMLE